VNTETTVLSKFKGISEDLLNNGIDVRINSRGLSMFPFIWTGDKITISPEKNLNIGDIIVFKRDDQTVCHRVVRVFEKDGIKYYQTRGDSHFNLDNPTTADQILGKVVRIERECVSLPRRILLFIHPALKFGRLNAIVISALIKIKNICLNRH
jgi:signal peptidase I